MDTSPRIEGRTRLLSRADACDALNISLSHLKALLGRRALHEVRLGRRALIPEYELARFIAERLAEAEVR